MTKFQPQCLPVLIGSLPLESHREATELIYEYTPEIPLWPQLPQYREEGMIQQYLPGLPGIVRQEDKIFVNIVADSFEVELLEFYEEYLMVTQEGAPLEGSRFELSPEVTKGFFTFLEKAGTIKESLVGLKGQITGPVTFCTGLADQDGRAIFYNDQMRDVAIKHLAMKAKWQTARMAALSSNPIMFFDEPGLAGIGSSAFITISEEDIIASLTEVFEGVRAENGFTGVHVCANTEWSVIFASGVDVISYDAYSFFDKLVLYRDQLVDFFNEGKILASGIVPTDPEYIDLEDADSLVKKWFDQCEQLFRMGIAKETVFNQTMITPSCGTGAVSREQAINVLKLSKEVSKKIRNQFQTRSSHGSSF